MRLCVLGPWVHGSCPSPRAPVLGAGCPPHSLAPPGTPRLPLWATTVLGRDMLCRECGGGFLGPMWQCHALERGWDLHRLHRGPACPEKSSQALSPPHPGKPLGLPSLRPSLVPGDGRGTLGMLSAEHWGLGHRSSILPVSSVQLLCHLPAHGDPSPAMGGRLAPRNPLCGPFPSLCSSVGPSGLHVSPQHGDRGRGVRVSVCLAERHARRQRLGVPTGSTGSVPTSWLHWAPGN